MGEVRIVPPLSDQPTQDRSIQPADQPQEHQGFPPRVVFRRRLDQTLRERLDLCEVNHAGNLEGSQSICEFSFRRNPGDAHRYQGRITTQSRQTPSRAVPCGGLRLLGNALRYTYHICAAPTELVPSGSPQEAVKHTGCVYIESRDRTQRIHASGEGPFGGTWNIKRGDSAVWEPVGSRGTHWRRLYRIPRWLRPS